jgi:hypothetical protein
MDYSSVPYNYGDDVFSININPLFSYTTRNILRSRLIIGETKLLSKYPPAKPGALRLLAPQRGLIAIGKE